MAPDPQLFLSRTAGGTYLITQLPPIVEKIVGTDRQDVFARPGEPVDVRHLCPEAMHALYKITLAPLEIIRIRLGIAPQAARLVEPRPSRESVRGAVACRVRSRVLADALAERLEADNGHVDPLELVAWAQEYRRLRRPPGGIFGRDRRDARAAQPPIAHDLSAE
jgi:hypothetical protein